jgi:hypothetical protein
MIFLRYRDPAGLQHLMVTHLMVTIAEVWDRLTSILRLRFANLLGLW